MKLMQVNQIVFYYLLINACYLQKFAQMGNIDYLCIVKRTKQQLRTAADGIQNRRNDNEKDDIKRRIR